MTVDLDRRPSPEPDRPSRTESASPPTSTPESRPRLSLWRRILRDRTVLMFAVPGMVILFAFQYYPLLGNVIAFQDFRPFLGIDESLWVGFQNFAILVSNDPAFLNALWNTLILTLIQAVLIFPLPIVLALMLNSLLSNKLRQTIQSILYLPHFLSWVIVVAVFQQMLGGSGMINNFPARSSHLPPRRPDRHRCRRRRTHHVLQQRGARRHPRDIRQRPRGAAYPHPVSGRRAGPPRGPGDGPDERVLLVSRRSCHHPPRGRGRR